MNILHIGKFYPPYYGGMETYLQDLAEAQVKQGHHVTVLVHNHDWHDLRSKTLVEQVLPNLTLIRQACWRPIMFTPLMSGLNKQVIDIIKNQPIDVIHLHVPNPSLFALLRNRAAKNIPWVIRWHSDMVTESSSRLLRLVYACIKPIESSLIKRATGILISSPEYQKKSPLLQQHENRVAVIPLGLNTDKITIPDSTAITDKPFKILTLGRLSYYKNHRLLIDAMKQLPDMHLTIAGGGDLYAELERYIKTNQLTDRVTLAGSVTDEVKQTLFNECHVFCLASNDRAESYGMVLLEAMARQKIILAADTEGSGMRWLATRYARGFTFGNHQLMDLVAKLNHIRHNYSHIIKQQVDFDLTIDQTAAKITDYYQHMLATESP
ncbi:glycosyltransferase [Marinicella gelatinilytica]|uniref:glycosyltransferase n=1 Tax=Marinicella gelatinilytica TaxID=2996017 RepID=UPI002260F81F|nr:glycosyltransferase [Marinicella gelatinilytica]MCX7544341.1 glycosyltransferase [Marinicella gelatinilytica]